jgi:hypothetical protein
MSPEDDFQTESTQQVITQEEQKVNFRRFAVIGLIIFLAAFYFVWQNFLNFGTLEIYGDIPYDVLVFDDQNYTCEIQPCELKMDRGEKSLSFYKFGFEAESQSVEVPLWSTVSTRVNFEIKPYMEKITVITEEPQYPSTKEYELKYDEKTHNYKLAASNQTNTQPVALSYFPNKLESPIIFGSDDAVLIIEQDEQKEENQIYFIDVESKSRYEIGTISRFTKILAAIPSFNGEYFLLQTQNTEEETNYWLVDSARLSEIETDAFIGNIHWTLHAELVTMHQEENSWIFEKFSAENLTKRQLLKTNEFVDKPSEFFPSQTARKLYVTAGEQSYEIVY